MLTITQFVAVPLTVSDCIEFAAKPIPWIWTCAPGLTATVGAVSFGVIV